MSHLLRRPAAVPALFSQGLESDIVWRRKSVTIRSWSDGPAALILPTLVLTSELPLLHGAAELLRLALPH